jgi:hypothetical protein
MIQLRVAVELEPIDGTEGRAWRFPERQLVIHQLTAGDAPIERPDWTWERPRVNWTGSGDPPKNPRAFVELTGGVASRERRIKLPSLVGLAALIGALGGVAVQCRQIANEKQEIERLEGDVAELQQDKGELEARAQRLTNAIAQRDLCGGPSHDTLEGKVDDCLGALAHRIQVQRDIDVLGKLMDSP